MRRNIVINNPPVSCFTFPIQPCKSKGKHDQIFPLEYSLQCHIKKIKSQKAELTLLSSQAIDPCSNEIEVTLLTFIPYL